MPIDIDWVAHKKDLRGNSHIIGMLRFSKNGLSTAYRFHGRPEHRMFLTNLHTNNLLLDYKIADASLFKTKWSAALRDIELQLLVKEISK